MGASNSVQEEVVEAGKKTPEEAEVAGHTGTAGEEEEGVEVELGVGVESLVDHNVVVVDDGGNWK